MDRKRLDSWCEKGILWLVLGILLLSPLANGANRPQEWVVFQGITALLLALYLVRFWTREGYRFLWAPACWTVVFFLTFAIWQYHRVPIEFVARQELLRIGVYAALFFIILDNLNRQETVQTVTLALIGVATFISIFAVFQFLVNPLSLWHLNTEGFWLFERPRAYLGRASGTFICPNSMAGFLEMLLPISLSYTLLGRFKPLTKVFLGYATIALLAAIGTSLSRGSWIASGVALTVFFSVLMYHGIRRTVGIVCIVVLVGASLFFFNRAYIAQKRVQSAFNPETGKLADERIHIWKATAQVWQDHLWTGGGAAHFDHWFRAHRPRWVQNRPEFAHNDYLNSLADYGVLGTSLILATVALIAWGTVKSWKFVNRSGALGSKPSNRAAFVLGASVGLIALLVHSLVDFDMHVPSNACLAIALMALLSGHLRFATERFWVNPRVLGRVLATILALAGIVVLSRETLKRGRELYHLRTGMDSTQTADHRLAALKQAFLVEPLNPDTSYLIGETLRLQSWQGWDGYETLAREAMIWFQTTMRLNPLDPYPLMRYGMCLDWLKNHSEAAAYYEKALALDPNNYYLVAHQGWHHFQTANFAEAKTLFLRSKDLFWDNPIADSYLAILEKKRLEQGENNVPQ